jgi:hypothetical protein
VDINAQNNTSRPKLKFGVNMPFETPSFLKMVSDTTNYAKFFKDYDIQYLRFPGGSMTRFFIYNSKDLTQQAKEKVFDYYKFREKAKMAKKPDDFVPKAFDFPTDYYEKVLRFCENSNLTPIITLNTCFYASNNKVYQVAPFRKQNESGDVGENKLNKESKNKNSETVVNKDLNLGDDLKKFLTDQINFTHKHLRKVTWEIGNEEYYMYDAEVEAQIVKFYIGIIQNLYPQDEVIVSFANAQGGEKKNKAGWNGQFVNSLNKLNLLQKINYFAPHFYVNVDVQLANEADIQQRIKELDFAGFEKYTLDYFPAGYTPHFFYTEFAVFLGSPQQNPNYNSYLHGLMMFYFLMNFYSSNVVDGVVYHSFLGRSPLIFLDQDAKAFNNNIVNKNSSYKGIGVIPIQAQAVKIFYDNVGDKFVKFLNEGGLYVLVTQTGSNYVYFIANLSTNDAALDKKKVMSVVPENTELSFTTYNFQDWNSKSNIADVQVKKQKYKDFNSIDLKKYSVVIVK